MKVHLSRCHRCCAPLTHGSRSRRIWVGFFRFCEVVICWTLAATPPVQAAGLTIQSIDPLEGHVGQTIKLAGDGFNATRRVHFLLGRTPRVAKFKIVTNKELEVIVPECYRADAEACIVIQTDDGIALTCPTNETVVRENLSRKSTANLSSATWLHVIQGGVVSLSQCPTLVESGGVVGSINDHAALVLVKSGGTLVDVDRRQFIGTTVIYEPGASFGPRQAQWNSHGLQLTQVPRISVSEGVGPFVYQRDPAAPELGESSIPPRITALNPSTVPFGEILTVHGKGFSDVHDVRLVARSPLKLDFHVVSDTEISVEIPDRTLGHYELMIVNSKGIIVTQALVRPEPIAVEQLSHAGTVSRGVNIYFVGKGRTATGDETRHDPIAAVTVVEKGGMLTGRHALPLTLVKSGGTLVEMHSHVYAEAGGSVPKGALLTRVESIEIVRLPAALNIVFPVLK